jgi:hypothetical protein
MPAKPGGGSAMYHTIEFREPVALDLEVSRKHPLERISVRRGVRLRAQIKPYVIDSEEGLIEVADLFLEDGTTTRGVRFACFAFVE